MNRPMRRTDKQVADKGWIEEVLRRGQAVHVAFASPEGVPYVVPLCYGYESGAIYIHGANRGLKKEMAEANGRVAFNVALDLEVIRDEIASEFSMRYRSVSGWGDMVELTTLEEKNKALRILMRQYDGPNGDLTEANAGSVWVVRIDISSMTGKISGYPKPE